MVGRISNDGRGREAAGISGGLATPTVCYPFYYYEDENCTLGMGRDARWWDNEAEGDNALSNGI